MADQPENALPSPPDSKIADPNAVDPNIIDQSTVDQSIVIQRSICATLQLEAEMILAAGKRLTDDCGAIVELLGSCRGRILLTGMGKTGFIARKSAATLCSTGAPAIFLHPAEAIHGDLGIVTSNDVLIALSNSGETEEILKLIEYMQRRGVPVIALTGNANSTLGRHSRFVIDCHVAREADELSLAPTCSTTLMLAVTDGLAIATMQQRGFTAEEFAQYHPGGSLGKKLLLKIADIMQVGDAIPVAEESIRLREAIAQISHYQLGCLFLKNASNRLSGVLTDGDLRRQFQSCCGSIDQLMESPVSAIMTQSPSSISCSQLAVLGLRKMEDREITVLPVVEDRQIVGVVHLHDLIKAGLV